MALHFTEISLPASHAALTDLFDWLAGQAARLGIPAAELLRLQLIAEELFINTVDHGFAGKTGPGVCIALARDGATIHVLYRDAAPAFDPCNMPVPQDSEALGGLGLPLVRGLSRAFSYRREGDWNEIRLQLAAESGTEA